MKEKKTAARARFTFLDAIIILLVILCAIGIWQRNNLRALFAGSEELEEYTVEFEIKCLRTTTATLLKKDTVLYLEEKGSTVTLGTVAEISGAVASVYLQDQNGNTVSAAYPAETYYDVSGRLSCRGTQSGGAFLLGGNLYLAAGQMITAHSEDADFELRIVGVAKTD